METENKIPEHKNDVKAESAFEFWLKRQFPHHSLRSMREAVRLISEGIPVPFLALYKKESIENLKSRDLYQLIEAKTEWEEISRKQNHLLKEIEAQSKLTEELKTTIERSTDLDRLEDLYVPFKLKRQSLGLLAREAGLGVLADYLWEKAHNREVAEIAGESLLDKAATLVKPDTKFATAEAVLKGVQDILVERIAEDFELRTLVRGSVLRRSKIRSTKGSKAKSNSKYSKYFEYQEPIGSLKKASASHRYLSMRRGWMEDELVLSFERPDEGMLLEKFEAIACPNKDSLGHELLVQAARLALKGNVYTVMENEAHRALKEEAEKHVIETLAENLQKKLLQPAFGAHAILGIDPGSANHPCSLAVVDVEGKLLLNLSFKIEDATDSVKEEFLKSIESLNIKAIAVAHSPKAKEIRDGFKQIMLSAGKTIPIISVHEHSANVYASSPSAKEEFPLLDIHIRRAIFVARYLQDPLFALLRLDAKFFSLGEFQHEVNQGKLRHALQETIEYSVNFVGADVNVAPAFILAKVAGLNIDLAKAIVQARETNGPFTSREELKKIPGMQEKNFSYAAGFLKVRRSTNPLDNSFIHPIHYSRLQSFAAAESADIAKLSSEQIQKLEAELSTELGETAAKNIAYELAHLGEDSRGAYIPFEYDPSIKGMEDLKKDIAYPGIVTNVTSFGAFVDIGVNHDGLIHISELSGVFAKNPYDTLFPGDIVTVYVSNVNEEKKQISLTMKRQIVRRPRPERPQRRPAAPLNNADGQQEPQGPKPREPRREREFRGRPPRAQQQAEPGATPSRPGEPYVDKRARGPQQQEAPKKGPPKKPQRDPKTGAVVKMVDDYKGSGSERGPRLPSKAQPTTFNPFANLANLLKDKGKDG